MNQHEDRGAEPGQYPCIETEKALSRAQGLLKHLQMHLPESWMQAQGKDIQDNLHVARESFREVLQNMREERTRMIEQIANAVN